MHLEETPNPWRQIACRLWLEVRLPKVIWEQAGIERPIGYNGAHHIRPPPKKNPSGGRIRKPNCTCLIPGSIRPTIPNRIHIRSAVLPQCTGQTDTHTDQQTVGGNLR